MEWRSKRSGYELPFRRFVTTDGETLLVFRTHEGRYHTFVEVEAKQAAEHCGATITLETTTAQAWDALFAEQDQQQSHARAERAVRQEFMTLVRQRLDNDPAEVPGWSVRARKALHKGRALGGAFRPGTLSAPSRVLGEP